MSTVGPEEAAMKRASLYETDETAWLEKMSMLINERRYEKLDYKHLSEYLSDMAKRDRREVFSRLTTLLMQLLK
jgi:Fe-S cluster biosynthesis and repair protein YggX